MKGHVSASGLKRFRDCPKSWWFRYASDVDPVEGETKYLDLGLAVHEAIEEMLIKWQTGHDLLPYGSMRYEVYASEHGVPDDLWDTGIECVRRAATYTQDQDPELLGIEDEIDFHVSRPDVDEDFTAKIDVSTDTEIWDWKTGSIREDTPEKEKIQGAVYMAAYRSKYGKPPEKIRFVYLKEEEVGSLDPTDEVWNTMLKYARSLTASKEHNDFPAKPGDKCNWCDYELFCAESGVGLGVGFDWGEWTAL